MNGRNMRPSNALFGMSARWRQDARRAAIG
jgi:hypothetical protein